MHCFRDNEVLLPTGYDVIVSPPHGSAARTFSGRILKEYHDFLIAFRGKCLPGMHGFRDNGVLLQAGYDVIVIYPLGVASRYFT